MLIRKEKETVLATCTVHVHILYGTELNGASSTCEHKIRAQLLCLDL